MHQALVLNMVFFGMGLIIGVHIAMIILTKKLKEPRPIKKPPGKKLKAYHPSKDEWKNLTQENFYNYDVGDNDE